MTLLLGAIFLGILALSFAIFVVAFRLTRHEKAVQKRLGEMALISAAQAGKGISGKLLKQAPSGEFAWVHRLLARSSLGPRLQLLIEQANGTITVANLLLVTLGFAMGGFVISFLLLPVLPVSAGIAAAVAVVPVMSLKIRRARWLRAFNDALPSCIDLMSRALRAGHSVGSAIEIVGEEGQEPVAAEFSRVFQQQNFGLPFRDALMQMARRVPSPDLRFVVTAMLVQKETGGNLTEILDRTVYVIGERLRIQGEVRIKTAQGRITGWILTLLPVILGLIINVTNPEYAKPLFKDAVGIKLLYVGAGMLVLGGLIIRKIVRIEV